MKKFSLSQFAFGILVIFLVPLFVFAADKPTLAELEAQIAAQEAAIARLQDAIAAERDRIAAEDAVKNKPSFSDVSVKIVKKEGQFSDNGSGTVVGCVPEGDQFACYVVTAAHVVRNADSLSVEFFNNDKSIGKGGAKVIGKDALNDVAIIKIMSSQPLPTASIAPEGYKVSPRDTVIAVGCPGGQTPPFVYSGKGACAIQIDRYSNGSNITTTCMPSQGASGGGLYNAQGQLIGVCSAHDAQEKTGLYTGAQEIYNLINKMNAGITISKNGVIISSVPCTPKPKK